MNLLRDKKTNWEYILIVAILAFLVGGGILAWQYWWLPKQEVLLPEIKKPEKVLDETAGWKTYRSERDGFEFKHPEDLGQKYIKGYTWPPKITAEPTNPDFICEQSQSIKTPQGYGSQEEIIINNFKYCVFTVSEGAAGTTYTTYKYITDRENKRLTIEFRLSFTNCGVFDETEMEECQQEKRNFDPTTFIDKILSVFRFLE